MKQKTEDILIKVLQIMFIIIMSALLIGILYVATHLTLIE